MDKIRCPKCYKVNKPQQKCPECGYPVAETFNNTLNLFKAASASKSTSETLTIWSGVMIVPALILGIILMVMNGTHPFVVLLPAIGIVILSAINTGKHNKEKIRLGKELNSFIVDKPAKSGWGPLLALGAIIVGVDMLGDTLDVGIGDVELDAISDTALDVIPTDEASVILDTNNSFMSDIKCESYVDGVGNIDETVPWDPSSPFANNTDTDLDGIPDSIDQYNGNNAFSPNPETRTMSADTFSNPDRDQDGIADTIDTHNGHGGFNNNKLNTPWDPASANANTTDSDMDGIPNSLDQHVGTGGFNTNEDPPQIDNLFDDSTSIVGSVNESGQG